LVASRAPFGVLAILMTGIALLLASGAGFACYSGLLIIPTVDLVPEDEASYEFQLDGKLGRHSEHNTYLLNTEFGLAEGLEAGLDFDLSASSDQRFIFNAKYLVVEGKETRPDLAVGLCNLGHGLKASPYVVATSPAGELRLHYGAMIIDGDDHLFCGADWQATGRLTLMGDYTAGSGNDASLAFNYQFNEAFGVMGGVMLPNGGGATHYSVHVVYATSL